MNHFWISQDITREGSSEIQRALSAANNTSDELRANAINVLGAFALMQCDTAAAEKAFLSSGELWQKVGNELRYAATVKNLGDVYAQRHDLAAATRHYTQALAVLERGGNVRYLGQCLAALAGSLQQLGDSAGSIQAYERAIEQFRVGDNRFFIAHALQNLLGVRWGRGELLSHRAECAELLELAEELQGPAILQNALLIASCFALDSGDAKSSARLLGASDALKDKGAPLQPAEIEYRKHLETKISAGLDDAAMRRAKREGRAMSTAEALQQAKALVADPEDL